MRVAIAGRNSTAATRRGARSRSDPRCMSRVNLHRGEGVPEFPRAAVLLSRGATAISSRHEPETGARFDWFIPIDRDGAHIGMRRAERPPTFEYLRRVVETAEAEGYYSLLIPTRFANGLFEETAPLAETWTTVTALAAVTRRIRFLVAVRPGFISTGLFAQMAAALDQISGGRLDLNVVPGGIQGDFERLGVTMDHDKRYEQAEEFIAALRALWAKPEPVVFEGSTIRLKGAVVSPG